MSDDVLRADRVREQLRSERYGRSIRILERTGSTNDDARDDAGGGAPDGHVIVADEQTRGRGARGRRWESPAGTDLYLSIVSRISLSPARLPPLTLAVGLGVARAIEALLPGAPVAIKWPNDVLLDGRKCAGVLVETMTTPSRVHSAVLGIGLDVNRRELGPELRSSATSLARWSGRGHERSRVLARLLESVEREVDRFVALGPPGIVSGVEPRLAWRGRRVRCDDVEGELIGLRQDGALRLRTEGGVERAVASGTLRLLDG